MERQEHNRRIGLGMRAAHLRRKQMLAECQKQMLGVSYCPRCQCEACCVVRNQILGVQHERASK